MRASVRAAFVSFSSTFEGVCSWMYLDVKGLVTTGIGNLIDPMQGALSLPFGRHDGSPATIEEIEREWRSVKSRQDMSKQGGGAFRFVTALRLTPAGIDQIVGRKLAQSDSYIRARFPQYEDWPADAQLATMSMAWACGTAFANEFPHLERYLKACDFDGAAAECEINPIGNPGIVPRNTANHVLFTNAARSRELDLDPDRLWYPRELGDEPPTDVTGYTLLDPPVAVPTPLPTKDDE